MSFGDHVPIFDPAWILFEDADILVVDKPAYVPSQASDEGKKDDIVSRLSAFLEARDGKKPYVGTHQRLDKDTSGLLVFAARKEANKGLAAAFEGRKVVKGYVAGVTGWPPGDKERTLHDRPAPGDDGIMTVVPKKDRRTKAQDAVTHVRIRERMGARSLLELTSRRAVRTRPASSSPMPARPSPATVSTAVRAGRASSSTPRSSRSPIRRRASRSRSRRRCRPSSPRGSRRGISARSSTTIPMLSAARSAWPPSVVTPSCTPAARPRRSVS
ncbi:MAG: pseudouridine synthase [Polyangiaceae bacterium]